VSREVRERHGRSVDSGHHQPLKHNTVEPTAGSASEETVQLRPLKGGIKIHTP
jgi:hypothetical protein